MHAANIILGILLIEMIVRCVRAMRTRYYFVTYITGSMEEGTARVCEVLIDEHPLEWFHRMRGDGSIIFWVRVPKEIARKYGRKEGA